MYATEVVAENVILLGGEENGHSKQESGDRQQSAPRSSRREDEEFDRGDILSDDVPF